MGGGGVHSRTTWYSKPVSLRNKWVKIPEVMEWNRDRALATKPKSTEGNTKLKQFVQREELATIPCSNNHLAKRGMLITLCSFIFRCFLVLLRCLVNARGSIIRFPVGAGNFSLHHRCVQTGSGVHPASYPMGTRGSFPEGKATGAWIWPLTSI
jgi:hypothetical protein